MLGDHADAVGDGVCRGVEAHGLSVEAHLAFVGMVEAVEDGEAELQWLKKA